MTTGNPNPNISAFGGGTSSSTGGGGSGGGVPAAHLRQDGGTNADSLGLFIGLEHAEAGPDWILDKVQRRATETLPAATLQGSGGASLTVRLPSVLERPSESDGSNWYLEVQQGVTALAANIPARQPTASLAFGTDATITITLPESNAGVTYGATTAGNGWTIAWGAATGSGTTVTATADTTNRVITLTPETYGSFSYGAVLAGLNALLGAGAATATYGGSTTAGTVNTIVSQATGPTATFSGGDDAYHSIAAQATTSITDSDSRTLNITMPESVAMGVDGNDWELVILAEDSSLSRRSVTFTVNNANQEIQVARGADVSVVHLRNGLNAEYGAGTAAESGTWPASTAELATTEIRLTFSGGADTVRPREREPLSVGITYTEFLNTIRITSVAADTLAELATALNGLSYPVRRGSGPEYAELPEPYAMATSTIATVSGSGAAVLDESTYFGDNNEGSYFNTGIDEEPISALVNEATKTVTLRYDDADTLQVIRDYLDELEIGDARLLATELAGTVLTRTARAPSGASRIFDRFYAQGSQPREPGRDGVRGSQITSGDSLPTSNILIRDLHVFPNAVASISGVVEADRNTPRTSIVAGDYVQYNGSVWVFQSNIRGPEGPISTTPGPRGSKITISDAFPTTDVLTNDMHLFPAAVASGLVWRDTDGTTPLTSASQGDYAQYNGMVWVRQGTLAGGGVSETRVNQIVRGIVSWYEAADETELLAIDFSGNDLAFVEIRGNFIDSLGGGTSYFNGDILIYDRNNDSLETIYPTIHRFPHLQSAAVTDVGSSTQLANISRTEQVAHFIRITADFTTSFGDQYETGDVWVLDTNDDAWRRIFRRGVELPSVDDKTSNYTIVADDRGNSIRAVGVTPLTFTLPNITGDVGIGWEVVVINASSRTLTLDGNGADTISGNAMRDIPAGEAVRVQVTSVATWSITADTGRTDLSALQTKVDRYSENPSGNSAAEAGYWNLLRTYRGLTYNSTVFGAGAISEGTLMFGVRDSTAGTISFIVHLYTEDLEVVDYAEANVTVEVLLESSGVRTNGGALTAITQRGSGRVYEFTFRTGSSTGVINLTNYLIRFSSKILDSLAEVSAHAADASAHSGVTRAVIPLRHTEVSQTGDNHIILTPNPPVASYVDGMSYQFTSPITNTGHITVAISGLESRAVRPRTNEFFTGGEVQIGDLLTLHLYRTASVVDFILDIPARLDDVTAIETKLNRYADNPRGNGATHADAWELLNSYSGITYNAGNFTSGTLNEGRIMSAPRNATAGTITYIVHLFANDLEVVDYLTTAIGAVTGDSRIESMWRQLTASGGTAANGLRNSGRLVSAALDSGTRVLRVTFETASGSSILNGVNYRPEYTSLLESQLDAATAELADHTLFNAEPHSQYAELAGADFIGPVTVQTPTLDAQAASKGYVDSQAYNPASGFATTPIGSGSYDATVNGRFALEANSPDITIPAEGEWAIVRFGTTADPDEGDWHWLNLTRLRSRTSSDYGDSATAANVSIGFFFSVGRGGAHAYLGITSDRKLLFASSDAGHDPMPLEIHFVIEGVTTGASLPMLELVLAAADADTTTDLGIGDRPTSTLLPIRMTTGTESVGGHSDYFSFDPTTSATVVNVITDTLLSISGTIRGTGPTANSGNDRGNSGVHIRRTRGSDITIYDVDNEYVRDNTGTDTVRLPWDAIFPVEVGDTVEVLLDHTGATALSPSLTDARVALVSLHGLAPDETVIEEFARKATPEARFPESRYNLRDGQLVFGIIRGFTPAGTTPAEDTWLRSTFDPNYIKLRFGTEANATAFAGKYTTREFVRIGADVFTAVSIAAEGTIILINITNAGSGYTSAPIVAFDNTGTNGSGAAGTAVIDAAGTVTGINLSNLGSGYTSAPTITFSGGGGTGATAVAVIGTDQDVYLDLNEPLPDTYDGQTLEVRPISELVSAERVPVLAGTGPSPTGQGQGAPGTTQAEVRRYPQHIVCFGRFRDQDLIAGNPPTPDVRFDDILGPQFVSMNGWSFPSSGKPSGINPLWQARASANYSTLTSTWGLSQWTYERLDAGRLVFASDDIGNNISIILQAHHTHFATRLADGFLSDWVPLGQPPESRTHIFNSYNIFSNTNRNFSYSPGGSSPLTAVVRLVLPLTGSFDLNDFTSLEFQWRSFGAGDVVTHAPARAILDTPNHIRVVDADHAVVTDLEGFLQQVERRNNYVRCMFGGPQMVSQAAVISSPINTTTTGYTASTFAVPNTSTGVTSAVIDFTFRRAFSNTDQSSRVVTELMVYDGSFGLGRLDIWGVR